jgi:hypothetical protein
MIISQDGLIIGTQVHPEKFKLSDIAYSNVIRIYELFFRPMLLRRHVPAEQKTE